MKSKGGPKPRGGGGGGGKHSHRPGGGGQHKSRPAGGGGGGTRSGGGGGGGGGPYARARFRGGPARGGAARGPTHCPMCGEVVTNLSAHIRTRHDDPASHPRE
jgi:hypothetical protein